MSEMVCAKCLKRESEHYKDEKEVLWCVGNVSEEFGVAPPLYGLMHSVGRQEAEIIRKARKRCLDEFEALAKGDEIEAGIGSDVHSVYLIALQRYAQKGGRR